MVNAERKRRVGVVAIVNPGRAHTRTHARMHACTQVSTQARTHARTHAHANTHCLTVSGHHAHAAQLAPVASTEEPQHLCLFSGCVSWMMRTHSSWRLKKTKHKISSTSSVAGFEPTRLQDVASSHTIQHVTPPGQPAFLSRRG